MKKVSTNHPKITSAVFLGLMILGSAGGLGVSQDDSKANEGAKASGDANAAKQKDYGVLFGTAYGPDDRPMYRVHVIIHPLGKNHPRWEHYSDHRGEFAQRVPPTPADYLVTGEIELAPVGNTKPHASKKIRLKGDTKVHTEGTEWHDFSLHLSE
jgi:hypothetical protein